MVEASHPWSVQVSAQERVGAFLIGSGAVILTASVVLGVLFCFKRCAAAQRRALRDDEEKPLTALAENRQWSVLGRARGRIVRYALLPLLWV